MPTEEELEQLVQEGQLTEQQALRQLEPPTSTRPRTIYDINRAHEDYTQGRITEELFWNSLLRFVEQTVRRQALDRSTFSNIEDAISDSALELWQRLKGFDPKRSAFRTFATVVVLNKIRDCLRRYKADRGGMEHIQLEEEDLQASKALSAEDLLLFAEWLQNLEPTDRAIVRMLKDGLTQTEISQVLNISQQAVSKRLARIQLEEKPPFRL
jgi:RNA polymerase sigma factor (sigma-70 family)